MRLRYDLDERDQENLGNLYYFCAVFLSFTFRIYLEYFFYKMGDNANDGEHDVDNLNF